MDYVLCSMFSCAWEPVPEKEEHFLSIFTDICNGTYADQISKIRTAPSKAEKSRLKKTLKCFTPCGTFSEKRAIDNINEYNSIVVLDIDGLDVVQSKFLKIILSRDKFVSAMFVSPSYGLKIFVQVDLEDHKHHNQAFEQVKDYIEGNYSNYTKFKVDPSGKDITRLCFVSDDPEGYYNTEASVFEVQVKEYEHSEFISVRGSSKGVSFTSAKKICDHCVKMVKGSRTGSFVAGNRNNYVYVLSCLMNEFGVPNEYALDYVCGRYPSLGFKEIKTTVNSAYRGNAGKFGTRSINSGKSQNNLF